MKIADRVQDILIEIEHLENMLEILEIGFDNCSYGDHKSEVSVIHVINGYLKMIKKEHIEKLADSLSNA